MTKSVQLREKEALREFLINRRSELGPSIDFQNNILNNIKPLIEEIEKELDVVARYHDQIEMLDKYFVDESVRQNLFEEQQNLFEEMD